MLEMVTLNAKTHLRFFARNRLILVLSILMLGFAALSLVPSLFLATSVGRFELMRMILSQLGGLCLIVTSSLGLLSVSSHVRGRTLSLVVTKPCSPEVWLAALFVAGATVVAAVHLGLAGLAAGLSAAWGVPYQAGFAFVAVDGFFRAMIWFSYLTALGAAFHPVLAVLIALLLNEETLYGLKFMIAASVEARGPSTLLSGTQALADGLYFVVPMVKPLSQKTEDLYSSYRVIASDWPVLLGIGGYTCLTVAFFFALSALLVRRRPLA